MLKFSLRISAAAVAFAFTCGAALAAESPQAPNGAPSADSVTQHTLTLDGKAIAYTARAGTITLTDKDDKPVANVFYTAYTADGVNPMTRPVTFIYNGGPGSSTMWLRMGSFGPVRVAAPNTQASKGAPYSIGDNANSLLDKSDLVFIDMPNSGFGRNLPGHERDFFGVDTDAGAFGQFVQTYLSANNRWNSPKFLFGESYGTTRSAALSDWLLTHGTFINGIVLLSSILNYGLDYTNGDPVAGGDWAYIFYLPTEAATAWYHNRVPNRPADVQTYVSQVEQFGLGEYLTALSKGDKLSSGERARVARTLAQYLGVSQQFVLAKNLRVDYPSLQSELMRSDGAVFGRLDGRYQTYTTDRSSREGPDWDPTGSTIDGPYNAAINQYLRQDLKYSPGITYRSNIYDMIYGGEGGWDFSHNGRYPTNVAGDLADVLTQNPNVRVFSAAGYYDFATPFFATDYTLRHLNLNPGLQQNISYHYYPAGHMVYLDDASLAQFKADLSRWYDSVLGH